MATRGVRDGWIQARRVPAGLALLVVCCLLVAPDARSERRVEVYAAQHRVARELAPIASAAMDGHGSVAVDERTNSLVLVGEPRAVAEALALLAVQDRELRSVVLRYDSRRVRDLEAQGFELRWTARAGDFAIGNVRPHRAGKGGDAAHAELRVESEMRRLVDSFTGTIRVLEGTRARIEQGTSVPYVLGQPRGRGQSTEYVTATTGFDAGARILADGKVQVDLEAFAGRFRLDGLVETMRAAPLVVLTPGETVAVGGIGAVREQSRTSRAGASHRSSHARDRTVLLLRADLEG